MEEKTEELKPRKKAPKKRRKKRGRPKKRISYKRRPRKLSEERLAYLRSPENVERMQEAYRKRVAEQGAYLRPSGQPWGMRMSDYLPIQQKAIETAERAVKIMAEKGIWKADNDVAERAMKTSIQIMEQQGSVRERLQAAKTILEFTQTKPVAKTETTLKNAEAFLAQVLEDDDA